MQAVCAQVYRGKLRETGEEVAVKVQRPGIGEAIAVDMVLLRRFITIVDRVLPSLLPPGIQVRLSRLFMQLLQHRPIQAYLEAAWQTWIAERRKPLEMTISRHAVPKTVPLLQLHPLLPWCIAVVACTTHPAACGPPESVAQTLRPECCVQLQPLLPLVDEFAARLFGELDYIQEGKNSEKFASLYGKVPRVRVPKVYWQYTARRVLCMEWIDGALPQAAVLPVLACLPIKSPAIQSIASTGLMDSEH